MLAEMGYHPVKVIPPAPSSPVLGLMIIFRHHMAKGGLTMSDNNRLLSVALLVFGATFCLVYPLAMVWPSGWAWHEGSPAANNYFMMIVGLYATLGLFLLRAAKDPIAHASLIWFTVWSSVVHAAIMTWQSLTQPGQQGHLLGDVPALLLVALVLGVLMNRTGNRSAIFAG